MSRRPPTSAEIAERNRVALKALVKLDSNKSCADCKRNKHPRWASWNLGVFVCIRCSGIHRSLGVHISRVKSVDLDTWTEEQMNSMVKWGNRRANRYWENKLAEGHVPNEAKIENFIRTKYDSRRWVMDGPMPDPSTLDDGQEGGDDDVPLKIVQERARASSGTARNGSAGSAALPQPPRTRPQDVDLFGDPAGSVPQFIRPNTTEPAINRTAPQKAPVAPPKQTRPGESLLGLDFFGGSQSALPARPSSTGPTTSGMPGRTDLKQSILSLYASKPAAPPQQPQPSSNMNAFGGMQPSSPMSSGQAPSNMQALGGLGDAFGGLSFGSTPQQQPPAPAANAAPFSGLISPTGHTRQASTNKTSSLSGGSFFDTKPAPPLKQSFQPPAQPTMTASTTKPSFGADFGGDFGDFSSAASPPISSMKSPVAAPSSNNMGDLFGFSSPPISAPTPPPKPTSKQSMPPPISASNYTNNTAFNLSQPAQPTKATPAAPLQTSSASNMASLSNMDAWGSNDAWATPDPTPVAKAAPAPAPARAPMPPMQTSSNTFKPAPAPAPSMPSAFDAGWGDPEPASAAASAPAPAPSKPTASNFGQQSAGGFSVQQDEEFGGWSHASPVATTSGPKQGGVGGNQDDLFGNVWE